QQRLVIEHGAADQQRNAPALQDVVDQSARVNTETRGGIGLGRIEDIHQVVRVTAQRLGVRLGGTDIHAPVDQCRVDTDQFAGQVVCQVQRKIGLAGGGGAHQADHRR